MSCSLFFVVPVHGRQELTALCLKQLRWTCDQLEPANIRANAVVVGDDEATLAVAKELRFWVVEQENEPVARKFNDGIQAAHIAGAEYVVPCGSDNWVHPAWIRSAKLPEADEVVCHRQCIIVAPNGGAGAEIEVNYDGGDGIRIFPTELFKPLDYRPAADYRNRAIDTSIVERMRRLAGWTPKWRYHEWDFAEVVGFQSDGFDEQLNDYASLVRHFGKGLIDEPWARLAEAYPPDSVAEMERYFARRARKEVAA